MKSSIELLIPGLSHFGCTHARRTPSHHGRLNMFLLPWVLRDAHLANFRRASFGGSCLDLGWAELGCYGNTFNETPHLDKMAKEGLRFTHAYAAAPVCSPYRAALLTGQHPARVGILDAHVGVPRAYAVMPHDPGANHGAAAPSVNAYTPGITTDAGIQTFLPVEDKVCNQGQYVAA